MTRATLALCTIISLCSLATVARADLARLPGKLETRVKPVESTDVQLSRLMPSYTLSFLASVNTPESAQAVAQESRGGVHLAGGQVFYTSLTLVDANPGDGLGPGGDGAVDPDPPDGPPGPPPISRVPTPGALLLAMIGITVVDHVSSRRGRHPLMS